MSRGTNGKGSSKMNVGEATCGVGKPVSHPGHTERIPGKRSRGPQPSPAALPGSCEPAARAMPPLPGVGERCAPRATWSCIDEPRKPAGRSRSASLPTPGKGRAWRHRLLRAAGMSHMAAPRPSLKLPGMLDEPVGSLASPSVAQGQDERTPTPQPLLLHGLDSLWSGGSLPDRESGTRWRAAADGGAAGASPGEAHGREIRHDGNRLGDSVGAHAHCASEEPRSAESHQRGATGRCGLDSGDVLPRCMSQPRRFKRHGLIVGLALPHAIDVGWEADEVPCRSFFDFLPPNWTCAFQRIQLSSIAALPSIRGFCVHQLDLLSSHGTPILDIHMTRSTEDQGFTFPCCHHLYPSGFLSPGILFQVFERPDVVNLDFVGKRCGSTLLADLREEAFFEFGSLAPYLLLGLVLKGCFHIPGERDTAPGGNERVLALSGYGHLKALVLDPVHVQFGSVLVVHLRHRQLVFVRQRLCQRGIHDPFQVLEGMQIVGQSVVIDDATIFQLVGRQDRVITLVGQFGAMDRFAFALVPIAFFLEDIMRYTESNLSIDASAHRPFVAAALGFVLNDGDFLAQ